MLAHVPVCGARTRSLGGALLLLILQSCQAVWTRSLGGDAGKPRFNVAIERWNATHFLSVRNVQRPRYTRGAACRDAAVVVAMIGQWQLGEERTRVEARDPLRRCLDRRNFRLNGPEDARILNLHSTTYMIIYAEHAGNNRRQFFRFLHGYRTLSKEVELTAPGLNAVEKNWVPFLDVDQKPHVWRWLEDEDGYGVAHLIDLRSGVLGEALRQRSFLRSFVLSAPGPKAKICGGTPAVALNTTHRVGFGHVTRNRRYYTVFAYVFEAQSPFRMVACSKEFRFRGLGDESSVDFDVATRPDIEDMIQFPVGLVVDGDQLLVSWGRDRNRETRASSLRLAELGLARLPRLE